MQTTQAQTVTISVPTSSGWMPNEEGVKSGAQRSSVKNSLDGSRSAATIPIVVATDTNAQRARPALTASSPQRLPSARSRMGTGCAPTVVSCVAKRLRADRALERGHALVLHVRGRRDEERVLGDRLDVLQVVAEERLHLGPREGLVLHVDEERARERVVRAVLRRLGARLDALSLLVLDRDGLERVLVLLVVREAEVPQGTRVSLHRLHDDVVVLAGGVVGATCAFLTVH